MTPPKTTKPADPGTEPCANCGTLLAADQRYCLNCGDRRAEARLDFIDILSEDSAGRAALAAPVAGAAAAVPERTGAEGWVRHHAGLLSLTAVVLVTLVGGIVVGTVLKGSDSSGSTAGKPQVIKVEGAGTSTTPDSTSADSSDSSSGASSSSGSEKAEKGGSGSTKGVQSADNKSKKDIEKAADKGEPLSTGSGALPKTDDKPAGGGSDFQTIQ